jgi:DNA polymerase III delta' subunit
VDLRRPIAQAEGIEPLFRAGRSGRLAHAFLFTGPRGIGKFMASVWLAAGLLCSAGPGAPCGVCPACKKIRSGGPRGNHPDLLVVDAEQDDELSIKVERIAERSGSEGAEPSIEAFLDLAPVEGRFRPVLLREAHRMNESAQAALLKTLEEPRPRTLLVLETDTPDRLLATIRSRCLCIRFSRLSASECVDALRSAGLSAEAAAAAARLARGSPGEALALAAGSGMEMLGELVALLRGERDPLVCAGALAELEGEFAGKTPLARSREKARMILDLALGLCADLMALEVGRPAGALAFGESLVVLAGSIDLRRCRGAIEGLLRARADLDRNLAPEATLERGLLALERVAALPSPARRSTGERVNA